MKPAAMSPWPLERALYRRSVRVGLVLLGVLALILQSRGDLFAAEPVKRARRPNIVFILADDK